ncbi:MAG: hypothetical protein JXR37_32385 [Kiritimatiellae bacterium]|nr:hypothetical protein [Kiritimatiellia bacterium]
MRVGEWVGVTAVSVALLGGAVRAQDAAARTDPDGTGSASQAVIIPDTPVCLRKVPVSDCRILRGFAGEPVDGTLKSSDHWFGRIREYPPKAGAYAWSYNNGDGLHITLADDGGFDVVVLRGGARAEMYADATHIARPGAGTLLHAFPGGSEVQAARLPQTARTRRVSFFEVGGGKIGDVAFYRMAKPDALGAAESWCAGTDPLTLPPPASEFDVLSVSHGMSERYAKDARDAVALKPGATGAGPLALGQGGTLHFVTEPFAVERGLAAVGIEMKLTGAARATLVVQDPLSPKRDLAWVPVAVPAGGVLRLSADIPDQVLPKDTRLWLTLICDQPAQAAGPAGGAPVFRLHFVPREQAVPEALAHRKFLMRTVFGPQSEAAEWMFRKSADIAREEYYAKSRRKGFLPELFNAIDQCTALGPTDDLVRQFREWVFHPDYRDKLVPLPPPPAPPPDVPDWAWYPRLAWLEQRRVMDYWLKERMAPTGEIGGGVQDDCDLYSELTDMPFLEIDGVGGAIRDAGARIAELADKETLLEGINKRNSDSTHGYEEGINHLALMARWFYGDPIYLERCMESARSVQKLTVLTPDGRRHFPNRKMMGHKWMGNPPPLATDTYTTPWYWHTALQAAEYNRNPTALKYVRDWADTWMRYMKPPNWPTAIDVKSGKVTGTDPGKPLAGGHGAFAMTFTWLYKLTGDRQYIEPFLHYYRKGEVRGHGHRMGGLIYGWGGLDELDEAARDAVAGSRAPNALRLNGNPGPLIRLIIGRDRPNGQDVMNLMGARRFPDMATLAPQATDRFLRYTAMEWAIYVYLGGACKRSAYVPHEAVSWEGFGTDYGACVLKNRHDGLKIMIYSFADATMSGAFRVWELEHGQYRVTTGVDADRDGTIDGQPNVISCELLRADRIPLTLAPKAVTIVEVAQTRKLDPIFTRADLAIAAREVAIEGNSLSGTVHNIGAAPVPDATVALVDATGKVLVRQSLGTLEAPLDLMPRTKAFTLQLPAGPRAGWRLALDPDAAVPEIYEGNNEVRLDELPAVDYRKGWE